jgi:hypothetical protein
LRIITFSLAHNFIATNIEMFSSPIKRHRIELDNLDIDCPSCDGWLRFFAYDDDVKRIPIYVSCSNDYLNEEGVKKCSQKVMLSKFSNNCSHCKKLIKYREIIACSSNSSSWMHVNCFKALLKAKQEAPDEEAPKYFALCLRCRAPIAEEADGIPDRSCPDPDELPRPDDDPDNPSMLKFIN